MRHDRLPRNHARKALTLALRPTILQARKPREPRYGPDVITALSLCWAVLGAPSGKRLAPIMGELVPTLRRFRELMITDDVACPLIALSPATMDRRLAPDRDRPADPRSLPRLDRRLGRVSPLGTAQGHRRRPRPRTARPVGRHPLRPDQPGRWCRYPEHTTGLAPQATRNPAPTGLLAPGSAREQHPNSPPLYGEALTDRERAVLNLMAQGLTNVALSEALHLSVKTIEGHVRGIFTTLGLQVDERDHRRVPAVLAFLHA